MTTLSSTQSSYFPSWNKGHESPLNHLQAKRTTLVSFPKTRQALWDSEKLGADMTLHLSSARNVTVQIVEKTLRLAYQHAVHANSIHFNSFLVGSVETVADEEGIAVILNRFDPGRDLPGGRDRTLTAKLPGDFVAPICFSFQDGDQTLTHKETDFLSAFKYLEHSIGSRECVDLTSALSLRIHCLCYEGTDDITLSLHVGAVTITTPIEMGPINSIPIIPTALARNLAGPISLSQLQNSHKFGLITMDQTRKLLLLLDTDPKAYALPLIGIWVSGVNYIHSPVILTACLKFLFSRSIQDRALTPSGGFLLLLYSPIHKHPLFYECKKGNQAEGMTFDLIGCKDQLHLYKHGDSSGMSDVHLELTAARDGPSKELFLQTLKQFQPQVRSQKAGRKASLPEMTSDPHLVPRQSPKPTLTKSPTIIPSVPEVSLIFDNVENAPPSSKMGHPSPGYRRPGPLRELNQSATQLEQRTAGLMSSNGRFSGSKSAENQFKYHDGMVENNGVSKNGSFPLHGVRMGEVNSMGYGQRPSQRRESLRKAKRVEGQNVLDSGPLVSPQNHRKNPNQLQDGEQCRQGESKNQQRGQNVISGRRQSGGLEGVQVNRTFPLDHHQVNREKRQNQQRLVPSNGAGQRQTLIGQYFEEEDLQVSTQSHQQDGVRVGRRQEEMRESQSSQQQNNGHGHKQYAPGEGKYPPPQQGQLQTHQWQQHGQHLPHEGQHTIQQRKHSPDGSQQTVQQRQHSPQQSQHILQQRQHSPQQSQHIQKRQHSPQQSQHILQQRQHSPQQSQHTIQKSQHSPQQSQHILQQRQHSPHGSQYTTQQRQHSLQQSQHTVKQKQHSPQQSQHTLQEGQYSPRQGQLSPTQQTSITQNMNDSLRRGVVREGTDNGSIIHTTSAGEDSAFIQLKKQEKMIEALQEQIRYLLQLQGGSPSPGLMTPPATPPSIPGQTCFPFPSPQAAGDRRQPPTFNLPSSQPRHLNAPHQVISGGTSHSDGGDHPMGQGSHKQMATISTNTGQSLFFHNQSDPSLPQDEGLGGRVNRAKPLSPFATTPGMSDRDNKGRTSTTDSSVQGSVSDSALSADPEFQLDLENTRDDTESLGKVELTSYPDSGSVKSSPDGSPTKRQHSQQSTTSPSQSPSSGHNTTIVTPKMPTLVSPVLGESASTCKPGLYHHLGSRRTSPHGVSDIPAISEEPNSEETDSDVPNDRMQTPSLLHRDQRQFYQNLLGQVENFLQEDDESGGEGRDEESSLEDGDASSSEDEESSEDDEGEGDGQPQTPRGVDRSVLLRSLFCSPDFHPHINYVSLADMGMGPSDISVEADAIAMKYLSDDELAKISSDLKHNRVHEDGVNPLLRTVLTAGLSPRLTNEKSMIKSRVEFSFATRKYLERHGLGDGTMQNNGLCSGEDEGKVLKGKGKSKKKKRKRKILHKKKSEAAKVVLPVNTGGRGGINERLDTQERPHEAPQQEETVGNILDWNKLKNLPKLF